MNRKMIVRTTRAGCFILILAWAMLALPGSSLANPPDGSGNHTHSGGGGGGDDGGGGRIPVTVTLRDFQGDAFDPIPDRLISDCHDCPTTCDCLSPYIHKVDSVGAHISTRGNFIFGVGSKGKEPQILTLFYDFSDCIEGPCTAPFQDGFSAGPANMHTSGVSLREMNVGEVRDDLSVRMALDLTSVGGGVWQLFFDPSDARCSGSTNITVRRIDADTWEIEAGVDDVVCLAEQVGGGVFQFSGLYRMPFKITVQK